VTSNNNPREPNNTTSRITHACNHACMQCKRLPTDVGCLHPFSRLDLHSNTNTRAHATTKAYYPVTVHSPPGNETAVKKLRRRGRKKGSKSQTPALAPSTTVDDKYNKRCSKTTPNIPKRAVMSHDLHTRGAWCVPVCV